MTYARRRAARASARTFVVSAVAVFAVLAGLLTAVVPAAASTTAPASLSDVSASVVKTADLSKFQPGNIMSNAVFFNKTTMTEAQIQSFLQSKVPSCRSGYTCLKDWYDMPRTTSADAMCGAYAGGTRERASRIIFKVAQACGINPQVILVMLQKEQGLVMHTWPSSWRYTIAMGQGCPDTAACDTRYYGFFNQVFGAAWQLKRYANPPGTSQFFTWYAPGKTWNVRFHPNASCGTSPVYVSNQATANLYYYTPYQPNRAALSAGYGTGDACSAYGNRNFYQYFTDWFGSTQVPALTPTGAIATEWKRTGGASGPLGSPAAAMQTVTDPNGNGLAQKFAGGWIHSSGAGTFSSLSPIMVAFSQAGWIRGDLGWPAGQTICTGGICTQPFGGGIISHASGANAVTTLGVSSRAIDLEHTARGGAGGPLGKPAASVQVVSHSKGSGLARQYVGGWIHSSQTGTFSTTSKLMAAYSAKGWVRGSLGWPTGSEQSVTDPNGNGIAQAFQGGWIHSSARGTFASSSKIMAAYSAAGWVRGSLGWPTGAEVCAGGACVQPFTGGVIGYIGGGAATADVGVTPAAITSAAAKQISVTGVLGSAQSSVRVVADPNGVGLAQNYERGAVHSSRHGTFVSSSTVMTAYHGAGWVRGELGWPTGIETCSGGVCSQSFDGGSIVYTPGKAAVTVLGMGAEAVTAARAAGSDSLGKAMAAVQVVTDPNGNGLARKYAGGWLHASARGVFSSSSNVMSGYSAAGWLRGFLGWPKTAEQPVTDVNGNGVAQAFEGGWVHASSWGSYASSQTVMTAYSAAGRVSGALSWPVGTEFCTGKACVQQFGGGVIGYIRGKAAVAAVGVTPAAITAAAAEQKSVTTIGSAQAPVQVVADVNGSGMAQRFANGWVHSSDRGTFVSSSTVMAAYSAAGWLRGALGWPTKVETCSGTVCSQAFEGGTISYTKGKPATVKLT
ncbi:hypothetical protein [Microbacterium sp. 2FI]|uniref:LGFP repeat-containing protein n=1 Tax=Microbacterium sp. 2FI TaxID=2502193 RepID=UPI0010F73B26|nr:hypothetical protein [Microbacterium sp. 2FI]